MKIQEQARRSDGRRFLETRPIAVRLGAVPFAEGSAEAALGRTRVIATASLRKGENSSSDIPVTLHLIPRAMRIDLEDQSLKYVVMEELRSLEQIISSALSKAAARIDCSHLRIKVDCHVICSNAGIATAGTAASWAALFQAFHWAADQQLLPEDLYLTRVAAISAGIVESRTLVDLNASESAAAEFTGNFLFDENQKLLDIRAASEGSALEVVAFMPLLEAAKNAAAVVLKEEQRAVLELQ